MENKFNNMFEAPKNMVPENDNSKTLAEKAPSSKELNEWRENIDTFLRLCASTQNQAIDAKKVQENVQLISTWTDAEKLEFLLIRKNIEELRRKPAMVLALFQVAHHLFVKEKNSTYFIICRKVKL